MFIDLKELAPHLLGVFMIALACIPLVFVWQDRSRKRIARQAPPPAADGVHIASGR